MWHELKNYFLHGEWTPKKIFVCAVAGVGGLMAFGFVLLMFLIFTLSIGLPDVTDFSNLVSELSTEIYDRDGKLLYTIHGEENRRYVPLDQISNHLENATIAIEDDQFYLHHGFDLTGIAKGLIHEVTGIGAKRGGSTITQQYVKNAFLTPKRTYIRKIKELVLAVRLEQAYDKKKILELYLNQIPYGNNAYGAEKAAQIYFGKPAKSLTLAESAVLAALPQAPSYYNPYGQRQHSMLTKKFSEAELKWRDIEDEHDLENDEFSRGLVGQWQEIDTGGKIYIRGRADIVLQRMADLGYVTEKERTDATNEFEKIKFNEYREKITAPHFVFYVKELLEQKYGKDMVERGGLKVTTAIDGAIQAAAEKIIEEKSAFYKKNYKVTNMSAVTLNPKNGHILAMIGSRDYFDDEIDGKVNVVMRPRNTGSAFKPIVYAQTFYNGYTPATVLYDTPVKVGPDTPQNYSGDFRGPMSIRQALGQSRNIPAVKAYFLAGEQDQIIELAKKLGITTLDPDHEYGYPLAIGAGEIKPFEMTIAFSTFANNGKRPIPISILKAEDANGKILEEWKPEMTSEFTEVLDPQVAYLINSILSDQNVDLGVNLHVPGHATAAKTGTSTKETKGKGVAAPMDLWTVGYTPSLVTAVWAGDTRAEPLAMNADGYNVAAPVWKHIMTEALKNLPDESFEKPEGIQTATVDSMTGLLPTDETPKERLKTEVFASFAVPAASANIYETADIDVTTGKLANEYCAPENVQRKTFIHHRDPIEKSSWQAGVMQWFQEKAQETQHEDGTQIGFPPQEYSPNCTKEHFENRPSITVLAPENGDLLPYGVIDVTIKIQAPSGVKKVDFYFDNHLQYTSEKVPYTGKIRILKNIAAGTKHLIRAKAIDTYGYPAQSVIEVTIEE